MKRDRTWRTDAALIVPLAVGLALALGACDSDAAPGKKPARGGRPFPVEVEAVGTRDVRYTVTAIGSVEAFERVVVTARVTGVVERVRFAEGQAVAAGQPLVDIEPRRFELAVASARAALARAEAAAAEAAAGVERREAAVRSDPGLIPGEEIETWKTRASTASAEVAAARVALERAQLDRRDASVRAPVAGVLQTRTVTTGQYVQPGTELATLVRRDPLLLRFEVPLDAAPALAVGSEVSFTVGGSDEPRAATVTLVSTAADPVSRLVPVTARIDPKVAGALQPGAAARVTALLGEAKGATVVPLSAVRASERGFLAYLAVDGKAEERVVELGMRTADGMVEVVRGLAAGEPLVVRGAEALRPGAPLAPGKAPATPAAPGQPAAPASPAAPPRAP